MGVAISFIKGTVLAGAATMLLASCTKPKKSADLVLTIPDDYEQLEEVVYIDPKLIEITDSKTLSILVNDKEIPTQFNDVDGDGVWDEILVLIDFEANENRNLILTKKSLTSEHKSDVYTNISFSVKSKSEYVGSKIVKIVRRRGANQRISNPYYQLEGPGIENDKVAFRVFFDPRNGKDIFGKLTNEMILEGVGVGGSWHKLSDWGMDILHVGKSLGAGGLGIVVNGELSRLGDADEVTYQELYTGSLESSFQMNFLGWDAGDRKIEGYERLTLTKGKFYYRNDIGMSDASLTLAVGMPSFKSDSVVLRKHNDTFSSISTFSNQADGTDSKLGLAILFSTDQYAGHGSVDDNGNIAKTHFVALDGKSETSIYFFACWEMTDSYFSEQANFNEYLQKEADNLSNPIQITRK